MSRFGFKAQYGAGAATEPQRLTFTREVKEVPDDPLVYVRTGALSYLKVKRSEAAAYCRAHGLPLVWEERDARKARLAREHAARPLPEPGTREAFIQTPHRDE